MKPSNDERAFFAITSFLISIMGLGLALTYGMTMVLIQSAMMLCLVWATSVGKREMLEARE